MAVDAPNHPPELSGTPSEGSPPYGLLSVLIITSRLLLNELRHRQGTIYIYICLDPTTRDRAPKRMMQPLT